MQKFGELRQLGQPAVKELAPRAAIALLVLAITVQVIALLTDGTLIARKSGAAAHLPPPHAVSIASAAQSIVAAHLFGSAPAPEVQSAQPLQLALQGTLATDDPAAGFAIIEMADKKSHTFAAGTEVDANTRLLHVYSDRVVISYLGARQTLMLPRSALLASLLSPVGGPALVREEDSQQPEEPDGEHAAEPVLHTANYAAIADYVEFLPASEGKEMKGAKVTDVKDPEQMAKVGLQEGDVITALDGQPIRNNAQIAALEQALSHGGSVHVSIERNGQTSDVALQAID
jgi:type II secretion system protein C